MATQFVIEGLDKGISEDTGVYLEIIVESTCPMNVIIP
jgi:hypothetical protein